MGSKIVRSIGSVCGAGLFVCLAPAFCCASGGADGAFIEQTTMFIFQVGIILVAARLGGAFFHALNVPAVMGEFFSGVIIGPYLLGSIPLPGFAQGLFPVQPAFPVTLELYGVATLASIILLFMVGLETNLDVLFRFSLAGALVGCGGVVVSFVFCALSAVFFLGTATGQAHRFTDPAVLFLGIIGTATSVGISARILADKRKMDSPEGTTILSAAIIDDVLGIVALAIIMGMIRRKAGFDLPALAAVFLKTVGLWLGASALGIAFARPFSRVLKRSGNTESITIIGFALALLAAGLFEKFGLAMIIGAYVAGISLSKTDLAIVLRKHLRVFQQLMVPVFFCVMGMMVNIRELFSPQLLSFGLIYLLFSVLGKFFGGMLPAYCLNFTLHGASIIGLGMVPRGEVALIIAGIGLASGIISQNVFSSAVFMVFMTTLFSPPLMAAALSRNKPALRQTDGLNLQRRRIRYRIPNRETAELLQQKVLQAFEQDGFYALLIHEEKRYELRRDNTFISFGYAPDEFIFDCAEEDATFVHTLFYEALAQFESVIKNLEKVTERMEIGRKIFENPPPAAHRRRKSLAKYVHPEAVRVALQGNSKEEIVQELVTLLAQAGQLPPAEQDTVVREVMERERHMSTGMQEGIALPHARTRVVDSLRVAIGIKKDGAGFESLDGKPAQIFVLTLAPEEAAEPYLEFIAQVSAFFSRPENRGRLLSAQTDQEVYALLATDTKPRGWQQHLFEFADIRRDFLRKKQGKKRAHDER
ncbi:MAG: cation:proton antiporter [Candidatus Omnitrophica bacterium]|nr:cation:proton antiporter [Candidatus Omnitrophota bacterium]